MTAPRVNVVKHLSLEERLAQGKAGSGPHGPV